MSWPWPSSAGSIPSGTSGTTEGRGTAARTTRARRGSARSAIPIATQIAHAAGYALGQLLDGTDTVTVACFGDGATSEGDFHEAANMAGVWRLPLVLFCQNNGWAISVPTARQTAGEIWRRAEGYGFPGVRVDGNDVLAVYTAVRDAVTRARAGDGPTLIEALTYRIGAHSTADDAARYRDPDEVERARAFDPIARYETWMRSQGLVDDQRVRAWDEEAEAFALSVREGLVAQGPPPEAWAFDWVYANPPEPFLRQREEALGG